MAKKTRKATTTERPASGAKSALAPVRALMSGGDYRGAREAAEALLARDDLPEAERKEAAEWVQATGSPRATFATGATVLVIVLSLFAWAVTQTH